jgi:hypothetical protein
VTVKELLAHLNDLTIGDLDKEVYVDAVGDDYKKGAFYLLVNPNDETELVGVLLCEADPDEPVQLKLPFEEIH